jgi:two-component system, cell cycle sensor histidine kinase and response regulator CckA
LTDPIGADGREIVIVEDEQIVALDIRIHLQRFGYRVRSVFSSGEEYLDEMRLRAVAEDLPDLVLMDINLQGSMDGITAAGTTRDEFRVPVILLTAFADDETIDRAKLSEPFAYIIKPYQEQELRTAVVLALYRNEMEQAIRRREELLSGILGSIDAGVLVEEASGRIAYANERASTILGVDDATTLPVDELLPEIVRQSVRTGAGAFTWNPGHQPDRTIEVSAAVLNGDTTVWVLNDTTLRVRNEQALRRMDSQLSHAQRMDAIGRMSGGMAHDFNNLVTVIMGYTRLALDDIGAHPELAAIRKNLEGILATARRSAVLTRQLLTFSRVQQLREEDLLVDQVLEQQRPMIDGLLPEYVELHLHKRAEEAVIRVDRSRLEQIVLNLILNARDAMANGGVITLTTETIAIDAPLPTHTRTLPPGDYLLLRVADTGEGISSEHLPHVFEPFFTTKDSEYGSGFGLATVYSAVEESNGAIDVVSSLGNGSVFSIYLPLTAAQGTEPPAGPRLSSDSRGTGTILLVQQEEAMRSVMGTILRNRGFRHFAARSVGDAILLLEREKEIDAVVSDLSAPFLSAPEIVRRYRAVTAAPVILVVTGEPVRAGQDESIVKPFEPEELVAAVRSVVRST